MSGKRWRPALQENWDILAILLFLSLALRLWFALAGELPVPAGRELELTALARGGEIGSGTAPLYVLFLRTVYTLSGQFWERAVFALQGMAGAAVVIILYQAAIRISSRWVATAAASIAAVYPYYIFDGLTYSGEAVGTLFVTILVLLAVLPIRGKVSHAVAGCVAAASVLTAPITLLFIPGLVIVFRRRWIFLLCTLVVLVPWTVRNSVRTGRPVPVYEMEAYDIDASRFRLGDEGGILDFINDIYNNASILVSRGGVAEIDVEDENIRSSNYVRAYSYMLIVVLAVFGLLKGYDRSHRPLALPAAFFLLFVIIVSLLRPAYRVFAEYAIIFYAAVALRLACSRFTRMRSREAPGIV